MVEIVTYAVYRGDKIQAAGNLHTCWTWIMRRYFGDAEARPGIGVMVRAADLAEEEITIMPIGDHHNNVRGYHANTPAA